MAHITEILLEIVKFIGLIIGVWMIVEGSEPVQWIKELLNIHSETKSRKTWVILISRLLSCCKCTGFWVGLIYYQSIELGLVTAIASEIFHRSIGKVLK